MTVSEKVPKYNRKKERKHIKMFRVFNCLFLFLNLSVLISGLVALAAAQYFQTHGLVVDCQNAAPNPLRVFGAVLIVTSLIGLIGGIFRLTFLLWVYALVVFLVLVGMVSLSVVVYVANRSEADAMFLGFKKHNMGDTTLWLKNTVANDKLWSQIRTCLVDSQFCQNLDGFGVRKAEDFLTKNLSPAQTGCCKPPKDCGLEYKNATFWEKPEIVRYADERVAEQCGKWSNRQDELCFDCETCKNGVVEMSKVALKIFTVIDAIDIAMLIIMFTLSCVLRKSISSHKKYNRVNYP